jgi:hypothetical protein
LPLPEVVLLPLALELLPSLLEPVDPMPGDELEPPMLDEPEPDEPDPDPDEPLVPELVPEEDSPDPAEVSELPEPGVLVPPEGERDVFPLRPCDRELFCELLEPCLAVSAEDDEVSDDVPTLPVPDPCDPCEAESDDPVPPLDCPLDAPVPLLDPLDCASAVPASARTAAALNVPTQFRVFIRDAPLEVPSRGEGAESGRD